jgi:hypothetical protein
MLIPFPFGESSFETCVEKVNTLETILAANYTVVNKIRPPALLVSGTKVRLTVEAGLRAGGTVSATYIGLSSISGDPWDFASTPTQITWDTATSLTLLVGKVHVSDEIDFTLDATKAITIAYNITSGCRLRYTGNLGTNYLAYSKSGVSEAGTVNKGASYVPTSGYNHLLTKLEAGT